MWCPIVQSRFDGINCPHFKGRKCIDVCSIECITELKKQREDDGKDQIKHV